MKRGFTFAGLIACCSVTAAVAAQSESASQYPTRPIRVVAAQSAGSSLDTLLRLVTPKASELLGQQFVIDNRGGAGGTMGVELASRAAPDGYTLLAGASSSMIVSRFTYRSLPFDVLKDFDPVSNIVNVDAVVVAHPSVPVKSAKDLVALAKAQPGKLNMASAGVGSSSHLAGVMFTSMAGIDTVHIPYKGGGPMAAAIIAGEATFSISPAAAVVSHIKAGRVRGLAITSKKRSPLLPDLPTVDESAVPGYEYVSWNGVFVPRGTPRAIVAKLHTALQKALADPEVVRLFAAQGLQPSGSTSPEEFGRFFRADFERNAKLVQIAGIKPD
ncbi:MAG TPA: tripartite tricarboxylate transporter substrate binding protein [Burkholderiales bacterium]|nr:tripartite tricarboxylate transporter substrate binding protein [Burkholderiales bacterium]